MRNTRNPKSPRLLLFPLLAALLLATATMQGAGYEALLSDEDQALLLEAVEAAFELDLYNTRCRSDQSGRRTENLNKELVSRYRMTVVDVLDDLSPEGYYRDAQTRMTTEFIARLREVGGCPGAKAAGLRDGLGERYATAMERIASRP
jgi:hypothetical protein